jgi:hypothetical protein
MTDQQFAKLETDIEYLKSAISEIKTTLAEKVVRMDTLEVIKTRLSIVERITYGLVAMVLVTVLGIILKSAFTIGGMK